MPNSTRLDAAVAAAAPHCRVAFAHDLLPEYRAVVEPLVYACALLIPTWCHHLYVRPSRPSDLKLSDMYVVVNAYERRYATLYVGPGVLANAAEDPEDALLSMVEELTHLHLAPYDNVLETAIEDWAPKDERKRYKGLVEDASESCAADLKRVLRRLVTL